MTATCKRARRRLRRRWSVINFFLFYKGTTYFHKSVDALGKTRDADYLPREIKSVVMEVGPNHIMQVVTDNRANYKEACKLLRREYLSIVWQPCLAHMINLMLKDIGDFFDHQNVIALGGFLGGFTIQASCIT